MNLIFYFSSLKVKSYNKNKSVGKMNLSVNRQNDFRWNDADPISDTVRFVENHFAEIEIMGRVIHNVT